MALAASAKNQEEVFMPKKKEQRKKQESKEGRWEDSLADAMSKDISAKPFLDFSKKFANAVLPSEDARVAREEKKLASIKKQIKLKKLQIQHAKLLKELEGIEKGEEK